MTRANVGGVRCVRSRPSPGGVVGHRQESADVVPEVRALSDEQKSAGMRTSAAIGDIFFIMIRTRKVAIMAKPRIVSMRDT
jgi:hypothetical protein